jgi:uncharacterized protein (DUF1684 family)
LRRHVVPPATYERRALRIVRSILPAFVAALAACGTAPRPYSEEIAAWRAQKDQFMRESSGSPVPEDRRASFPPLVYFPIDESYRIPAELRVVRGEDVMEMPTSTGLRRRMRRIGTLEFTLKGARRSLAAFAEADDNELQRLFVPFGDLTNGAETYQGGRYLDLDRTATGLYDLDFNRAYNPFCVFNPSYDCPIPPRENRLDIPVRSGEKMPEQQ